jgi:hypothetical protein
MTIKEWLIKHNIQFAKHDVAQWGSYTLAISFDGQNWLVLKRYGRAFEVEDAAELAITETFSQFNQDVINWMGQERYNELKDIITNNVVTEVT